MGIIRISTNNPEALAFEIKKLAYIEKLETDLRGISIRVAEGMDEKLYEDAPKLAKKIKVKILGIETGSASLEELYRLAFRSKGGYDLWEKVNRLWRFSPQPCTRTIDSQF